MPTPSSAPSNSSHQAQVTALAAQVAVLASELLAVQSRLSEDRETSRTTFVTKDTFSPIQKLVYGMTGLALTAVVTGILALVIHRGVV